MWFHNCSWTKKRKYEKDDKVSLWNEIKNWFHLLKVLSHISLGFPICHVPKCAGSNAWIQIIIMAWSFEAKLSKLFLMHSKRLFIRPHYCRQNTVNGNWGPRDTSHIHDNDFGSTLDSHFWFSCITSCALCCNQNYHLNQTDFRFVLMLSWASIRPFRFFFRRCVHSITLLSESVNCSPLSFMNSYKNNWSASIYRIYNPFESRHSLTDKCTRLSSDVPSLPLRIFFAVFIVSFHIRRASSRLRLVNWQFVWYRWIARCTIRNLFMRSAHDLSITSILLHWKKWDWKNNPSLHIH